MTGKRFPATIEAQDTRPAADTISSSFANSTGTSEVPDIVAWHAVEDLVFKIQEEYRPGMTEREFRSAMINLAKQVYKNGFRDGKDEALISVRNMISVIPH